MTRNAKIIPWRPPSGAPQQKQPVTAPLTIQAQRAVVWLAGAGFGFGVSTLVLVAWFVFGILSKSSSGESAAMLLVWAFAVIAFLASVCAVAKRWIEVR